MKTIKKSIVRKAQSGDTISKPKEKAWQHMTAGERGAKKTELVKKGGIELFNKYKDSISKQATGKLQESFEKGAKSKGMTNEQYSKWLDKQKKKPDQNQGTGGFNEKRYNQLPCSGGSCKKSKNGSKITKAKDGKWMQKAAASIKRRGTEGKCTPITKPGCTGKAKALAKTFKKIAAKRKAK